MLSSTFFINTGEIKVIRHDWGACSRSWHYVTKKSQALKSGLRFLLNRDVTEVISCTP